MTFHAQDGLFFEQAENGGVRIIKRSDDVENSEAIMDITLDDGTWGSIIAQMSYYGEEDYGWYRAMNFHNGTPLHKTTPLVEKPPREQAQ